MEIAQISGEPTLDQIAGVIAAAGLYVGLAVTASIGIIIVALMGQAAWLRLMVRDEVAPGFPLRLGADEGRLFLVNLCLIVFGFIGYIAVIMLFVAVNVALVASEGAGAAFGVAVVNTFLVFAVTVAVIILLIRFAGSAGVTIAERRIAVFGGFAASKGVTGAMFLSYLVLVFILIALLIFLSFLQVSAFMIAGASDFAVLGWAVDVADAEQAWLDFEAMAADGFGTGLVAGLLILVMLQIGGNILMHAIWAGPAAYAAARKADLASAAPEDVSAPAASVGAPPSVG